MLLADTMYEEFLAHPRMSGVRGRTVWIHIDVPGQGKHQSDLPPEYVKHASLVHRFQHYVRIQQRP